MELNEHTISVPSLWDSIARKYDVHTEFAIQDAQVAGDTSSRTARTKRLTRTR